jgi:hypothetical protein
MRHAIGASARLPWDAPGTPNVSRVWRCEGRSTGSSGQKAGGASSARRRANAADIPATSPTVRTPPVRTSLSARCHESSYEKAKESGGRCEQHGVKK